MKITAKIVQQVHRLWATGKWSRRKIARKVGLCPKSVRRIVDVHEGLRLHDASEDPAGEDQEVGAPAAQPPQRCPDCGGRVYLPCRLCRIRRFKQRQLLRSPVDRQPRRAA